MEKLEGFLFVSLDGFQEFFTIFTTLPVFTLFKTVFNGCNRFLTTLIMLVLYGYSTKNLDLNYLLCMESTLIGSKCTNFQQIITSNTSGRMFQTSDRVVYEACVQ